jgi:predicted membrane protein
MTKALAYCRNSCKFNEYFPEKSRFSYWCSKYGDWCNHLFIWGVCSYAKEKVGYKAREEKSEKTGALNEM